MSKRRFQQTGKGLGSDIMLTILVRDEAAAAQVFDVLWAQIQGFERRFSRFLPDSELSRFNNNAGSLQAISLPFYALLVQARDYALTTGGLYNPFVLPALNRAGYKGSWPAPDKFDPSLDYAEREVVPIGCLSITETEAIIPTDSALDFGGIGKGYLLGQLADYLDTKHVKNYWLSLGGDIVCAGFNEESQPWKVGIADALQPEETADFFVNETGERLAIATSGITKRKGPGWHHLIDPRSGHSAATDILTATLGLPDAVAADVFAKCVVILGSKEAPAFIRSHKINSALLQIHHNGEVKTKRYGSNE